MVGPSDLSTRTAQAIECLGGAISLGPPPLIEGEDGAAYNQLHGSITAAVKPKDFIEEILARDIADLSWEVLRLRRVKGKLLTSRVAAQIRACMWRIAGSEAVGRIGRSKCRCTGGRAPLCYRPHCRVSNGRGLCGNK